jgi:hypothetical protein
VIAPEPATAGCSAWHGPDLVTTSRGGARLAAFRALVESLRTCRGFGGRLIVVDQSPDAAVGDVATRALGARAVVLPSAPCGLSRARNLAAAAVTAPIVGFPDDDAVYFPDTLDRLPAAFADSGVQALCGRLVDPTGHRSAGMVRAPDAAVAQLSLWRILLSATSSTLFLRHPGWVFAEDLGVGTRFGAGEEIELLGRLVGLGGRVAYSSAVRIGHPIVTTRMTPPDKIRSYARGYAAAALRTVRQARSPVPLAHLALTAGAGVAGIVRHPGDPVLRAAYLARLHGLVEGLVERPR